ncbi:RNA polymerase II-associated [Irpex lacteus]|nr:RNA polymerase II-associated [Irpex lacteus]
MKYLIYVPWRPIFTVPLAATCICQCNWLTLEPQSRDYISRNEFQEKVCSHQFTSTTANNESVHSKLDLLVRVRYSNPLPAPPCPPKLLDIPTNPLRYTRPEFLNDIASDVSLPMIIDAECGMPLDLGKFDCLWEEGADDSELNPDPENLPELDPKDEFLLLDLNTSSTAYGAVGAGSASAALQNVSWLRKSDHRERPGAARVTASQEQAFVPEATIDVSHAAQIKDIEASFNALENFDLSTLKHPNKRGVTAVESYEVLPDADIWANAYDLFRFSERPGDRIRSLEDDPRLDCAVLRPMESDGDHFLAYYLTKEDETAIEFKNARLSRPVNAEQEEDEEATAFHFVRDYEVVRVDQEVPNEFLFVLDNGGADDETEGDSALTPSRPRAKGAYYKNIERKMTLKKRRINSYDQETKKWHIIRLKHTKMSEEEEREREEASAEVLDPAYLLAGGDADAEGEVEIEDAEAEPIDPLDALGD